MSIEIVFETHSLSEDNERGIATGWLPWPPARGRDNAAEMGRRRRDDGIGAVFTSDLRRAAETAEIAFGDTHIPILYDWRLRECDFGLRNGTPTVELRHDREDYLDRPYPGGESRRQAVHRAPAGQDGRRDRQGHPSSPTARELVPRLISLLRLTGIGSGQ